MAPAPVFPRVLVLTLSFGSGHTKAAGAIAQELACQAPGADVQVVDVLAKSRWLFRAAYVWPYWVMVRHTPSLWRRLFSARVRGMRRHTAPRWAFRVGCPAVFQAIERFRPDVIVAAEVAAGEIAAQAYGSGLTAARIISVITDHHAEPAWVHPEVATYAVADASVREQICAWGGPRDRVVVCGIPTDRRCQVASDPGVIRARHGVHDDRPIVLLMGGGMGPTRMDQVAAGLCASGRRMHIVAVSGHDRLAHRRLSRVRPAGDASLTVRGWIDDVPALMQIASVLVTKPGGVTSAEAAVCGVPSVLFDPIPGPEEHNAARLARAGAGVPTHGAGETVAAVLELLADDARRAGMSAAMRELATPSAAATIAGLVIRPSVPEPVLILTIANGAGHTRVAEAIAQAIRGDDPATPVSIVDVADYMSFAARLTHVTIYLWLVRFTPRLWRHIDRYQKRQAHTSPDWYYRRGCRRLFDLVCRLRPRAIVATEVGCAEIAALVKRDLGLQVPLLAVNGEYDADRAWVQHEVDLYSVPTAETAAELRAHGAPRARVREWGVPVGAEFDATPRDQARAEVCRRLGLNGERPIVLVGGGSEGVGRPDHVTRRILALTQVWPQIVVLTGRNARLEQRCRRIAIEAPDRVRVLGWTSEVAELMSAADLMVSKPGHTFDEAIASGLPLVSLPPPPGSECVQYRLLDEWNVGRGVRDLDELATVLTYLLRDGDHLAALRASVAARRAGGAAGSIARWLRAAASPGPVSASAPAAASHEPLRFAMTGDGRQ